LSFFSQNVQLLRKAKGLKQSDIPGFKASTWSNYETGVSQPVFDDLIKISNFFGIDLSTLIEKDLSTDVQLMEKAGGIKKIINSPAKSPANSPSKGRKTLIYNSIVEDPETPFEKEIAGRLPLMITVDSQGEENVLFVPVKARAGYLTGYSDPEYIQSLPTYRLPGLNNGTFRMFEVGGNSMYNTLHDHDIVIGSYIEQWRDVRDDRVHVVVTKNEGIVVKRVLNRFEKEGKFILKSDNYKDRDLYPPIVVDPSDILEFWYGIAFMSRQMRPPTETYKRVVDLEGRLTLLEDSIRKGR
jgi:transcriptional regulator with XRE-family HTH domain